MKSQVWAMAGVHDDYGSAAVAKSCGQLMRRSAAEEETCESETRAERGRGDNRSWRWSGNLRQGVNRAKREVKAGK